MECFYLLSPQQLPLSKEDLYQSTEKQQQILTYLESIENYSLDDFILKQTNHVFKKFYPLTSQFIPIHKDAAETEENKANDEHFNIIRVRGNTIEVLLYSVLKTYIIMMEDVTSNGSNIDLTDWIKLHLAFRVILNLYSQPLLDSNLNLTLSNSTISLSCPKESDAYIHWVQGHYVFMVITQGMIVALNIFNSEMKRNNTYDAALYLKAATILMQAAESALKYTGDFSTNAYDMKVRPTLMPPIAPPGMSGLNWRDHEFLIKNNFMKLREILSAPDPIISSEVKEFKSAISCVYDAHKFVCGKFVGNEETSLLTHKPAVEVLENFKHGRLSLLKDNKNYD